MIISNYRLIAACALLGMLGLFSGDVLPADAGPPALQKTPAPVEKPQDLRDPAALAELKRATGFLMNQVRLHFKATIAYDVIQKDGQRLQFEKFGEVYLQRPDRLFADIHLDDGRHRQFWYDGKTLSFAERSKNVYTRIKAPPTIDAMLDMLEDLFSDPMPLADLLYDDLSPLDKRASEAEVVGDSIVGGRSCSQLAFRGETVDWQIWIEQGQRPLIRKLAISYREQPEDPQYVAWINEWDFPKSFRAGLFKFTAPAGSQWVDVLVPKPPVSDKGGQP
jgi:hypothetical protein